MPSSPQTTEKAEKEKPYVPKWIPSSSSVLKLQIGNDEIRRIKTSSLFKRDKKGYNKLVDLAIKYSQGDDFDIDATNEDFVVKTTYKDEDGDFITFSSEHEFLEALQHRALNDAVGKFRVYAHVEKKKRTIKPDDADNKEGDQFDHGYQKKMENLERIIELSSCHEVPPRMKMMRFEKLRHMQSKLDADKGNNCSKGVGLNRDFLIHLLTYLESFLTLLTKAVADLQAHLAANDSMRSVATQAAPQQATEGKNACKVKSPNRSSPRSGPVRGSKCTVAKGTPTVENEVAKEFAKKSIMNALESVNMKKIHKSRQPRHRGIRCDGCSMNPIVGPRYRATNFPDYDLCENCITSFKKDDMKFEKIMWPKRRCFNKHVEGFPQKAKEENGKVSPTFVHGRHTCDGCMKSPIVGLRYHALNLKDYDLCSHCFQGYKGDDICFEAVELDRDRARQDLWLKKFEKASSLGLGNVGNQDTKKVVNTHIFLKAEEDLFFEGIENTARRVSAGDNFSLVTPKEQPFSSILSSYAMTHKLNPDTLEFRFENRILDLKENPEVVQLKDGDIVSIRQNKHPASIVSETTVPGNEESEENKECKTEPQIFSKENDLKTESHADDSVKEHLGESSKASVAESKTSENFNLEAHNIPKKEESALNTTICTEDDMEAQSEESYTVCDEEESVLTTEEDATKPDEDSKSGKSSEISFSDDQLLEDLVGIVEVTGDEKEPELKDKNIESDKLEDEASSGTVDEWDIVDEQNVQIQSDEMLAKAAQMVGSALFEEDNNLKNDDTKSFSSNDTFFFVGSHVKVAT